MLEIGDHSKWVVQDRLRMNTIDVDCRKSTAGRAIADLGVFATYDWDGSDFLDFRVGGFLVPVMIAKDKKIRKKRHKSLRDLMSGEFFYNDSGENIGRGVV